jgi:hypothetical protein
VNGIITDIVEKEDSNPAWQHINEESHRYEYEEIIEVGGEPFLIGGGKLPKRQIE